MSYSIQEYLTPFLKAYRDSYWEAMRATVDVEKDAERLWEKFALTNYHTLTAQDALAAIRLRHKAGMSYGELGRPTSDIAKLVEALPWYERHNRFTQDRLWQRAKGLAKIDYDWYSSRAKLLRAKEEILPAARMDRGYRMNMTQVRADSQQVTLADPIVGAHFPFVEYQTRDDSHTRPTHQAMDGFVCLRSWYGYPYIIPPGGFNCRCCGVPRTWREAVKRGWADSEGKPRFDVKWPNSESKTNFEGGLFPDKGWRGRKLAATF